MSYFTAVDIGLPPDLLGPANIYIATATLPKGDQANGIIENDPSYNTFWWWDSVGPNGVYSPHIKLEMSQGNTLYGPNASDPQKVGWRNAKSIDPINIERKFKRYFAKLAKMVRAKREE